MQRGLLGTGDLTPHLAGDKHPAVFEVVAYRRFYGGRKLVAVTLEPFPDHARVRAADGRGVKDPGALHRKDRHTGKHSLLSARAAHGIHQAPLLCRREEGQRGVKRRPDDQEQRQDGRRAGEKPGAQGQSSSQEAGDHALGHKSCADRQQQAQRQVNNPGDFLPQCAPSEKRQSAEEQYPGIVGMDLMCQAGLKGLLQVAEEAHRHRLDLRDRRQGHHPGEVRALAQKRRLDDQPLQAVGPVNQSLLIGNLHLRIEHLRNHHPIPQRRGCGGDNAESPQATE